MDLHDFIGRLFNFPRQFHPSFGDEPDESSSGSIDRNNDDDDDFDNGFSVFFGDSSSAGLEGMFEHFHSDMQRQMEGLSKMMDDLFTGLGAVDFPSGIIQPNIQPVDSERDNIEKRGIFQWTNVPEPFFNSSKSKRDLMLKEGAETDYGLPALPTPPATGDHPRAGKIYSVPNVNKPKILDKGDTDLDGKISEDKILEMIKQPNQDSSNSFGSPKKSFKQSFFDNINISVGKSINISTFSGPGNRFEQKRTVKNSSGSEEITVTRSMGDQSYSITTVLDKDGTQDLRETFTNMDKSDLPKFEDEWNKGKTQNNPNISMELSPFRSGLLSDNDLNFFSKLFGKR